MKLDSAVLYTNDIPKIVTFYKDFLGLELEYQQGDKFASFKFENGIALGIKKAVEMREKPGAQTIFVQANDIAGQFNEFKVKGAIFYKELTKESWGTHFAILDPDGNKVEFIKRAENG